MKKIRAPLRSFFGGVKNCFFNSIASCHLHHVFSGLADVSLSLCLSSSAAAAASRGYMSTSWNRSANLVMKIGPITTHLILFKNRRNILSFWASGICQAYLVGAQLFFSAIFGSRQRTKFFPLWSGILDVLPVALPVPFPVTPSVTLPVTLPALRLVALPIWLLVLLPVLLLNELKLILPVMTISGYTSGTTSGHTSGTASSCTSGTTSGCATGTTPSCTADTTSGCSSGCTSYTTTCYDL